MAPAAEKPPAGDQESVRESGSAAGAELGDFDLDPELDLGQHDVEPASPEPSRRPAVAAFNRVKVAGPMLPVSTPTLSSSSTSSAMPPRLAARRLRSPGLSSPCNASKASMPPMVRSDVVA
jgi:hypothetical protein